MQGLEAINAANGWAIALAGASIVLTGLATLSFIISQLHRVIAILEGKKEPSPKAEEAQSSAAPADVHGADDNLLEDLAVAAGIYLPLTTELGPTFTLSQLYGLMETKKLPHPHITVRELRSAGYLVPTGDGTFSWKNE